MNDDLLYDDDLGAIATLAGKRQIYYVGTFIPIDEGIERFYKTLDKHGHILVTQPEIYDYLYSGEELLYVIFYKSLTKLEYLEYMYEKKVGKNA
jgi:hypothetical protein